MSCNGWRDVKLNEIVELYNGKKRPDSKGTIPVFGGNGILDYCDMYNTDGENIIIGRVGAYCGNVNYFKGFCWVSDNAILVKAKEGLDSKYIYYYLIDKKLNNLHIGSSQPLLTQGILKDLQINLPPLNEQKAIAKILSDLDEKIEINNRINKVLEEIAQAIFRRWFVEFEFPNENGEPYKSSGGEMIESELGLIPKGWEVIELKDIANIQNGFAFKSEDYVDSGIKVLRTLNINNFGFFENNNLVYLAKEKYLNEKYNKYIMKKFDVALVMVGASIGKIGIVFENTHNSLQNQNMWRFRTKDELRMPQLLLYFLIKNIQKRCQNWTTGSARDFYRKDAFEKIKIVIPQIDIVYKFNSITTSLYEKINKNIVENEMLSQLRDTLLPKLMSGEIRVDLDNGQIVLKDNED